MTRPRGSGRHLLKLSAFGSKLSSRRSSRWCSGIFAFFYWVAEFVLSTALDSEEFYELLKQIARCGRGLRYGPSAKIMGHEFCLSADLSKTASFF